MKRKIVIEIETSDCQNFCNENCPWFEQYRAMAAICDLFGDDKFLQLGPVVGYFERCKKCLDAEIVVTK